MPRICGRLGPAEAAFCCVTCCHILGFGGGEKNQLAIK